MFKKKSAAKKAPAKNTQALFDDESTHMVVEPVEPAEEEKPKRREDKIFGNSFNLGNVEHEHFHEVKIESGYASSNLASCYDTEDYYQKAEMLDEVVVIFNKSQWHEMPLGKRFPKEVLPYIFQELYVGLNGKGYTAVDKVIAITEFMDLPYEKVYEAAGVMVKEQLIKELEKPYGTLSKKKINRLF